MFRGADVTIVPDLDDAGRDGAKDTASAFDGIAASVRIARLPGRHKPKDGYDVRDVLHNRDLGEMALRDAIENASEWIPTNANNTRQPERSKNQRPAVELSLDYQTCVDEVIEHLGNDPDLYQRDGMLVETIEEIQT